MGQAMTETLHVDRSAAERAVAALLEAVGAPLACDPELKDTPARVARMLIDEMLDGYRSDPAEVLREGVISPTQGLVMLTGVRFVSVCPHHLLPSHGRAEVGYLPGGRIAGLGTIVKLVEVLAHRLVLQETLGQQIADALVEHLGARGAGVVIRGRHQCLAARGERQTSAVLRTISLAGSFATDPDQREMFLRAVFGTGRRKS